MASPVRVAGARMFCFSRSITAGSVAADTHSGSLPPKRAQSLRIRRSVWTSGFSPCGREGTARNGVGTYEIAKAIGVTQKSAWFMDHRIRCALGMVPTEKLSGHVEADETFIGGKARN